MTIWLSRRFTNEAWIPIQDEFEGIWRAMGHPSAMLLALESEPGSKEARLLMRVPESLASKFAGFSEIPESQLPKTATCLVERDGEFWKVFERS